MKWLIVISISKGHHMHELGQSFEVGGCWRAMIQPPMNVIEIKGVSQNVLLNMNEVIIVSIWVMKVYFNEKKDNDCKWLDMVNLK